MPNPTSRRLHKPVDSVLPRGPLGSVQPRRQVHLVSPPNLPQGDSERLERIQIRLEVVFSGTPILLLLVDLAPLPPPQMPLVSPPLPPPIHSRLPPVIPPVDLDPGSVQIRRTLVGLEQTRIIIMLRSPLDSVCLFAQIFGYFNSLIGFDRFSSYQYHWIRWCIWAACCGYDERRRYRECLWATRHKQCLWCIWYAPPC
jgi:hypothetical protein